MGMTGYVAPETEVLEIEIESAILLYDSPTGEGYGNQEGFDGVWS